jgi:N-acetylglucosaminyl-diphospho-decaprenol L-rhamnosyltransferase
MSQSHSTPREPAEVAIAVVSWNTRELLGNCLRSIEPEVRAGRAEAWVVDNASSDGSAELVRESFPWAKLIALEENVGFGPAINLVAERTTSPWVAVSNADIELTPGSLGAMLEAAERLPDAGIIAPRLRLPDGTTQHSVYAFPTLGFALAFNLGFGSLSARRADEMTLEGRWNPDRPRFVDWAIGAFLLVRRQAWAAAGGFDPAQWMYAEDLDLGWRVAAAGFRTWYEPTAAVRHHGAAATSQAWGDARTAQWQRSTYAWMLRRRGVLVTRSCALVNTVGAGARAVLLAPSALALRGHRMERFGSARVWTRLHLSNLIASRSALENHR